jgi:hypothetical protein
MTLYNDLIAAIPELTDSDFDSDGAGDFIASWDYSKPLPKGFKVGK